MTKAKRAVQKRGNGWLARLRRGLPQLIGLMLLAGAVFVVQREFRHLRFSQVQEGLLAIPRHALLASAGWTVLAYFILSFYDRLACQHCGHRMAFHRTLFASFCSYVLSHNLGFSALSGAAVRFRLYGNWGLAPPEIARIIAFCSLTFTLGACTLIGAVLVIEPGALPILTHRLPVPLLRAIGLMLWGAIISYVVISSRKRQLRCFGVTIELPNARTAFWQVLIACLDVTTTAAIAYTLLPSVPGFGYPTFLAIYIASYTVGLLASVPGGLGVFDGAMLIGLSAWMPAQHILGMIFVFRIFYYIVPLFIAGLLFAGHELLLRSDPILARLRGSALVERPSVITRQSEAAFSVTVAVGAVSLCGAMLLGLGVLDPASDLASIIPPSPGLFDGPSEGIAAWLGDLAGNYIPSLIGAALMGLALGLSNRVTLAWGATVILLCVAAVLTALRGNSAFVPGFLVLSALLIAPFRSSYYRHARLLSEPFAPGTALPLLLLIGCVLILGRLEPNLRTIDANSWWAVLATGDATSRTRVSLGVAVLMMFAALWRLISPGRVVTIDWADLGEERYRQLQQSDASLMLPPDGVVLGETGRAAVAFARLVRGHDRLLVAIGDPVGAIIDQGSAIWRVRDLAAQERRELVFWQVGSALLHLYQDLGLTAWPLGSGLYLCCRAERGLSIAERLAGTQPVHTRAID